MTKKAFIFDLDGVIVDTAKYHFLAWKKLANGIGVDFTHEQNEQLKGVSRIKSLEKILAWSNKTISEAEFTRLMGLKNEDYLTYIDTMDEQEILPDVTKTLDFLRAAEQHIALGSASKNARMILEKVNILSKFDVIVDGNDVTKAKPDPEVFLKSAEQLQVAPKDCIVFEDAVAGIQAANAAGMVSIGIGDKATLHEADFVFAGFQEMDAEFLKKLITSTK
ncbi:beta-phosphoglucomutase [uncultured Gelidibacter sp.]|uniref:beta-phosphoglucomutase n=1 Tax=uncultured Gelidibacter sp. TaxID=259318 RepID=UPI002624449A|nr:beta-phosphoglucomutase [uncultured Gelidibacter sp.]